MGISRGGIAAVNLEPASRLLDVLWGPTSVALGTNGGVQAIARSGVSVNFFAAISGGGNLTSEVNGELGADYTAGSRQSISAIPLLIGPALFKTTLTSDPVLALGPIWRLLFRFMRVPTGGSAAPSVDFGIGVGPTSGGDLGLFSVTQAGFGVVMDGAGGWRLWARKVLAGPVTINRPLTWPGGDDTKPVDWELRITPATGGADAVLQVFANGLEQDSESWGNGTLPDFSAAGLGRCLMPCVMGGVGVGVTDKLHLCAVRIIAAEVAA